MRERHDLALDDIQGNILRPYGCALAGYLMVGIDDGGPAAATGREWLGSLVDRVTTAAPWPDGRKPPVVLNVGVSHAGLRALGMPERVRATFSEPFRQGMRGRVDDLGAEAFGDTGPSAPARWEEGWRGDGHLLVVVQSDDGGVLDKGMEELRAAVGAATGLRVLHALRSSVLDGAREHFGFADGFGQPAIEGSGHEHLGGQGTLDWRGRWRPVRAGEFVLGYRDEDAMLPAAPAPPFGDNGSYMVVRKLSQEVVRFRRFVAWAAGRSDLPEATVAAKMVGRWHDGTPLAVSPDGPDATVAGDKQRVNDFRYGDDPAGLRCPAGAHVRRTNPRDALDGGDARTRRHRIVRRGMPYGPPLGPGTEDDGRERGLMFVCFNASIARQFEMIQVAWCNDGDAFGLGADRDPLVGGAGPGAKFIVPGRRPALLPVPFRPFVVTRGGEYLFAPGISALRALAKAAW